MNAPPLRFWSYIVSTSGLNIKKIHRREDSIGLDLSLLQHFALLVFIIISAEVSLYEEHQFQINQAIVTDRVNGRIGPRNALKPAHPQLIIPKYDSKFRDNWIQQQLLDIEPKTSAFNIAWDGDGSSSA